MGTITFLTVDKLKNMSAWVFSSGIIYGHYSGGLVAYELETREGLTPCRWVAVRGSGYHDWKVYVQPPFDNSVDKNKLLSEHTVRGEFLTAGAGNKLWRDFAFLLIPATANAQLLYNS